MTLSEFLGDPPLCEPDDRVTARAQVDLLTKAIKRKGWTASEMARLYTRRSKWRKRAAGEDAYFREFGSYAGGALTHVPKDERSRRAKKAARTLRGIRARWGRDGVSARRDALMTPGQRSERTRKGWAKRTGPHKVTRLTVFPGAVVVGRTPQPPRGGRTEPRQIAMRLTGCARPAAPPAPPPSVPEARPPSPPASRRGVRHPAQTTAQKAAWAAKSPEERQAWIDASHAWCSPAARARHEARLRLQSAP